MRTIPLQLDADKASALYILVDIAIRSLSAEKETLQAIENKQLSSDIPPEEIPQLKDKLDILITEAKDLSLEIGALVDEIAPDEEDHFEPVIRTPV